VDDRIITKPEKPVNLSTITPRNTRRVLEDFDALGGCERPEVSPRATQHVPKWCPSSKS
jgi:cysteinyl-tRNA synthetase